MAITYNDLAQRLQELEKRFRSKNQVEKDLPGLCKRLLEREPTNNNRHQKIFFALDTTTHEPNKELPVIIAVGSNYGQGPNALQNLTIPQNNGGPAKEEDLGKWRGNLQMMLNALRSGKVVQDYDNYNSGYGKEVWRTGENINIYTNAGFREDQLFKGALSQPNWAHLPATGGYHLVMTNFCPFITQKSWSDHNMPEYPILEMLLDYGIHLNHLTDLKRALNSHIVLWAGHGNYDVYYRFFTYLVRGQANGFGLLDKNAWLFTSNLSRPPSGMTVC